MWAAPWSISCPGSAPPCAFARRRSPGGRGGWGGRAPRVVRAIGVRFRSGPTPLILLDPHPPAVISMAGAIRGLPVVFVERQREALERLVGGGRRPAGPGLQGQ